jgi:hypothetical protein
MPQLLIFVPAERVIVEAESGNASIIGILDVLAAGGPHDKPLPPNAAVAFNWVLSTLWLAEPGDDECEFEQRVRLVRPDGKSSGLSAEMPFEFTSDKHRINLRFPTFPIGQAGVYKIRLWLRQRHRGEGEWGKWKATPVQYPIRIKHT